MVEEVAAVLREQGERIGAEPAELVFPGGLGGFVDPSALRRPTRWP